MGKMLEVLNKYDNGADGDSTVADLLANVLSVELGNDSGGLGILQSNVTVSYYEHVDGDRIEYGSYDRSKDIKSLMWKIPFGQKYEIVLPELDFELGNDALPLQLNIDSDPPVLEIEWQFDLAFGIDNDDGFFLYTYPETNSSEFFIKAGLKSGKIMVDAKLLYFLNMELEGAQIEMGAGIFVDIDKEAATRQPDTGSTPTSPTKKPSKKPTRKPPSVSKIVVLMA